MAVLVCRGTQYEEMRPASGMKMMKVVFSQLTCWYQFFHVIGCSVISAANL
jgi:hypothetical protein